MSEQYASARDLYDATNLTGETEPGTVRIVVTLGRTVGDPVEADAIERALWERLIGPDDNAPHGLTIEPQHFEEQAPIPATFSLVGTSLEASDNELI